MRKKHVIISGALAASLVVTATMSGCSYASTDTVKDMKQVIAEVNITASADFDKEFKEQFAACGDAYDKYKASIDDTKVIKRELVSYFVNVGYSYYQYLGSYEQVFQYLVNDLTSTAVLNQYATTYILQDMVEDNANALIEYLEQKTEVEKYEYLLGGKDSKDVKIAEYSLLVSINSAIDSYEKTIVDESNSNAGSDSRAVPGNVDTEKEDYYPELNGNINYNIYTGYVGEGYCYSLDNSGTYGKERDQVLKDGSTKSTRIRAYTKFLSSLISNNLVDPKTEDLKDVRNLQYIQEEYVSQLKARVLEKYYDLYEENQVELLTKNGYEVVKESYEDLFLQQRDTNKTEDTFGTAIGDMSDTSFILYAPKAENEGTFGFVYNILLPFSASQSAMLTAYQGTYADEKVESGYGSKYYEARNNLLGRIKTTDQRAAWFNGTTDYAFNAKDTVAEYYGKNADRNYLFFENNLTNTERYEALDKYYGKYSYNGLVVEKEDKYVLLPNELDIDEMLNEFSEYINFVLDGGNNVKFGNFGKDNTAKWSKNEAYYQVKGEDFYKKESGELVKNDDDQNQIDYSKFLYATGKVDFGGGSKTEIRTNVLNKSETNNQYKVLSAVNELQYAYTTDTGVLSQYLGYSVEAGDTNYIKEFEYAAHEAINNGAGSFAVCAGDYGWHLIYVTYAFDEIGTDGRVYGDDFNTDNIEVKGTFENLFYEYVKSKTIPDISSNRRTQLISKYSSETTVTKYEKTYKDLLNLS